MGRRKETLRVCTLVLSLMLLPHRFANNVQEMLDVCFFPVGQESASPPEEGGSPWKST